MPDIVTTTFNPIKEDFLIQFRDCLFGIEEIDTALILFVSGARSLLDVNFMALVIQTGRNNLLLVVEKSSHSTKGVNRMKGPLLRIVEIITRKWETKFQMKTPVGNHRKIIGYLIAGSDERKGLNLEDALIWENLVAIASVVFDNLMKPDNNYRYEKNSKRKKRRPRQKDEIIDGLPVLRGMFVFPESLSDILPSFTDSDSFDPKTIDQHKSLMEG